MEINKEEIIYNWLSSQCYPVKRSEFIHSFYGNEEISSSTVNSILDVMIDKKLIVERTNVIDFYDYSNYYIWSKKSSFHKFIQKFMNKYKGKTERFITNEESKNDYYRCAYFVKTSLIHATNLGILYSVYKEGKGYCWHPNKELYIFDEENNDC